MIRSKTQLALVVAAVLWVLSLVLLGGFLWYVLSALGVLLELIAGALETSPRQ